MIVIKNNYIPFKGYKLMNFCGILFQRNGTGEIKDKDYNHENIHTHQMRELLYVFFYIFYILEWMFKVIIYFNFHEAYRDILFERESYKNQNNLDYLKSRKLYAQWRS